MTRSQNRDLDFCFIQALDLHYNDLKDATPTWTEPKGHARKRERIVIEVSGVAGCVGSFIRP